MNAQLSTTDTRTVDRTDEQRAASAVHVVALKEMVAEVSRLTRELREMTEHRDALARTLASINRVSHFRTAGIALAAHAKLEGR